MTINTRTGKPVIYICPNCEREVRGLMNGKCLKCDEAAQESVRQVMWADMEAGTFSLDDIT